MRVCAGYTYDELCSCHCCSYHGRQDTLMSMQICDTTCTIRLPCLYLSAASGPSHLVWPLRARFGCLWRNPFGRKSCELHWMVCVPFILCTFHAFYTKNKCVTNECHILRIEDTPTCFVHCLSPSSGSIDTDRRTQISYTILSWCM